MSYCVNCGVKLAAAEKKCPLCNTPVINPNDTGERKNSSAYSSRLEEYPNRRINIKYLTQIVLAVVALGIIVQTICNVLVNGGITWAWFGIGAFGLLLALAFPVLVSMKKPYIAAVMDIVAIALYILLIAVLTDGIEWYIEFYLPLHILSAIYAALVVVFMRKKRRNYFRVGGVSLLFISFMLILVELLLDIYIVGKIQLIWSLCCAPAFVPAAILLLVIAAKPKWREKMARKLYMEI